MARLLLHIGDAKCGSTAIQTALGNAHEDLAKRGILYKTSRFDGNHAGLAVMAGHKVRAESADLVVDAVDIIKQISDNAGYFDWILLSAESFLSVSPRALMKILELANCPHSDVTAICYVRDPISMYISFVQQEMKGSHFYTYPEKFRRKINLNLNEWEEFLGKDRLHVRFFDRSDLFDGDVIADFRRCAEEITGKEIPINSNESNSSLTAEQIRVMQIYRRKLYPNEAGKVMRGSQSLARLFQKLNNIKPIGQKASLIKDAESVIISGNVEIYHYLQNKFNFNLDYNYKKRTVNRPYSWEDSKNVANVLKGCDEFICDQIISTLPEVSDCYMLAYAIEIFQKWFEGDKDHVDQAQNAYRAHFQRLSQ